MTSTAPDSTGQPPPLLTDADLSYQQRTWVPRDTREAYTQWPSVGKVEMADGALEFSADVDTWDWRSVAAAARALPGWRITLRNPGMLHARQPTTNAPTDVIAALGEDAVHARAEVADQLRERMYTAADRWLVWCAQHGTHPLIATVDHLPAATDQCRDDGASTRDVLDLIDQVRFLTTMWRSTPWLELRTATRTETDR